MFYLKLFAGTIVCLIAINYLLAFGAKQVLGPQMEQAAANAKALGQWNDPIQAIPLTGPDLTSRRSRRPEPQQPDGWFDSPPE
jgi:hypothetical protein